MKDNFRIIWSSLSDFTFLGKLIVGPLLVVIALLFLAGDILDRLLIKKSALEESK